MTKKRTCRVCGCDISDLHFNCRLCQKKACRDATKRMYCATEKSKTASLHIKRYAPEKKKTDSYAAGMMVYSAPAATVGGRARGHVGTTYDPAAQVEERKNGLAWLLKGRKPEKMNVRPYSMPAKPLGWREDMGAMMRAAARKNGVVLG